MRHASIDNFMFDVNRQKHELGSAARFAELLGGLNTAQHWHCYVCYDYIGIETYPLGYHFLPIGDSPYYLKARA